MKYVIEHKIEVGQDLKEDLIKKYKLRNFKYKIIREAIDARNKNKVLYDYLIEIDSDKVIKSNKIRTIKETPKLEYSNYKYNDRPIIIGFGPAGIFSALYLARSKAKPIIIERGDKVDKRQVKVENFFKNEILDEESNVVYGEGGAGTFSDGKLQTNLSSTYIRFILEEFVRFGANPDILVSNYPHVGTDILAKVIPNIREEIIRLGGEFYFNTKFISYTEIDDGLIVETNKINFKTKHLILAIGHSARDTFKMLQEKGIKLEPKPFSVGVRIEHSQADINKAQYGKYSEMLPPANYKLVCHLKDRSVYTFCMCPGGYVVPSQNERNTIVTNGMSYSKRDNVNANSALLVEVKVDDYYKGDPLDGFKFIADIESKAYKVGNNYKAPASLVAEFLEDKIPSSLRSIKTSYCHDLYFCDLKEVLPDFVVDSLKEAIPYLDKKLVGFGYGDAILIAPETRSSCPVRIVRNNFLSSNKYIYAIGEGSGYAGGITSSALDGLKCAIKIVEEVEYEY